MASVRHALRAIRAENPIFAFEIPPGQGCAAQIADMDDMAEIDRGLVHAGCAQIGRRLHIDETVLAGCVGLARQLDDRLPCWPQIAPPNSIISPVSGKIAPSFSRGY